MSRYVLLPWRHHYRPNAEHMTPTVTTLFQAVAAVEVIYSRITKVVDGGALHDTQWRCKIPTYVDCMDL